MSCYTAAGLEVLGLASLLLIVGAYDVWCHVWRSPKNQASVNSGKSPARTTRYPR